MFLRIANLNIQIEAEHPDLKLTVKGPTARFLAGPNETDISVSARFARLGSTPSGPLLFDTGGVWRLFQDGDGYELRFFVPWSDTPYKAASFDRSFTKGIVTLNPDFFSPNAELDPLEFPLDELVVIFHLAQRGGALLHACGVVDRDRTGYLFSGNSGDGKTTIARLWQNSGAEAILSDDRVALTLSAQNVMMHGTPWHGEAGYSSPTSVRLDRLFFLRHGKTNRITLLNPAETTVRLLARSFLPFHDSELVTKTLELHETIARHVPAYDFEFLPDESAIAYARATKESGLTGGAALQIQDNKIQSPQNLSGELLARTSNGERP